MGDREHLPSRGQSPSGGQSPAILALGLTKVYGSGPTAVIALDGVDLRIEDREMAAIMGPSGSGKSTLLHVLGALETPTDGEIAIGGRRFEGLSDNELTRLRREEIGFVFQFFNLLPVLSAFDNILLPALIAGDRSKATRERVRELLDRVGLTDRADHLPAELSGGEQQRVSIARALLTRPRIVLADEPTGNLDSRSSASVLDLLAELNADEGQTLVMVTHDPAAATTAKRTVFLRDGRVAGELAGGDRQAVLDAFAELEAIGDSPQLDDHNRGLSPL